MRRKRLRNVPAPSSCMKAAFELLPKLHSAGDMGVTGYAGGINKPSGNASGHLLGIEHRLPESRDERSTFDGRGVLRARRSTASGCCRLTKRVRESEPV